MCDKTKNELCENLCADHLQLPVNNAFLGFVALLHGIIKRAKLNP